jgi:hypothetical protein
MNLGLDFDATYTKDPETWDDVIALFHSRGHKVHCVTCRRDTTENRKIVKVPGVLVFFTGLRPKAEFMRKYGITIDVWSDDDPACVLHGK